MQAITTIRSRTAVMPTTDIDTDQIIPARFLTTTSRDGLGKYAFNDLRYNDDGSDDPAFVLNSKAAHGCSILVAGNNFGCGSSREHAPWALLDFGIRVVISTEIADIFRSNSLKNGLLPVVVDKDTHRYLLANPGIPLTVDLNRTQIGFEDGRIVTFSIDSFSRHCLLQGVDQLGYLLSQLSTIRTFEEQRAWTP